MKGHTPPLSTPTSRAVGVQLPPLAISPLPMPPEGAPAACPVDPAQWTPLQISLLQPSLELTEE